MLLRDSRYKGNANFGKVTDLVNSSFGSDLKNYRTEFLGLVERARSLKGRG
jgi:hypothetical protein